jgi:hypothetical protein
MFPSHERRTLGPKEGIAGTAALDEKQESIHIALSIA